MTKRKFTEYQLQQLAKLPVAVANLAEKYPSEILTLVDYWDLPPFPEGYIPEDIDIYHGESHRSYLSWSKGQITAFNPHELGEHPTNIVVLVEDDWAYAQYDGKVIFDRLGGIVLPEILLDLESLLHMAIRRVRR
jgi:hypothetical protein